jgi:hypothetical protein
MRRDVALFAEMNRPPRAGETRNNTYGCALFSAFGPQKRFAF